MTKPSFVYVTFIASTREKVWQALVDPSIMRQYWIGLNPDSQAHVNVSDWKPGSRWEHQLENETRTVDIVGKVIECAPPSRLVFSWARPSEEAEPSKHSVVTFEIEQRTAATVKLTVTHDGLDADPKMLAGISGGWPQILSNLKSLLETGKALPR